jgi:hypothetical protein
MRDLDKQEMFELEALIDSCGLSSVLMALSEICGEKGGTRCGQLAGYGACQGLGDRW